VADEDALLTAKWVLAPGDDLVNKSTELGKAIGKAIGKAVSDSIQIDLSKFSTTGNAGGLTEQIAKNVTEHVSKPRIGASSNEEREAAGSREAVLKRIEPAVAVLESIAAISRGRASIGLLANQLLKPFLERAQEREGAAGGATGHAAGARLADAIGTGFLGRLTDIAAGAALGGALGGAPGAAVGGVLAAGGSLRTAGAVGIAVDTVQTALEAGEAVAKFGEKSAHASIQLLNMSKLMGITGKDFLDLRLVAAKSGVDVDEFTGSFQRLGIVAQRRLPEIRKQYEDAGDTLQASSLKIVNAQGAAAKARIALDQAPQHAALEEKRGALSVEGAQFGVRGAELSTQAAREKYRQIVFGETPDPADVERRQKAQAKLALDNAKHNEEQARTQEKEIRLAEDKRKAEKLSGLGIEDQAQQQAEATALAQRRAEKEGTRLPYTLPSEVERYLRGERALNPRDIEPEAFQAAIFNLGGGEAGGIIKALRAAVQGPFTEAGLTAGEKIGKISEAVPGILRGGGNAEDYLRFIEVPQTLTHHEEEANQKAFEEAVKNRQKNLETISEHAVNAAERSRDITAIGSKPGVQAISQAFDTVSNAIITKGIGLAEKLAEVASRIAAAGKGGEGTTAVEPSRDDTDKHASGGLIGGYGSGTSDSNLIYASKGEYMIRADGSNLNDAISHFIPGYAGGGEINPDDKLRRQKEEERRKKAKELADRRKFEFKDVPTGSADEQRKVFEQFGFKYSPSGGSSERKKAFERFGFKFLPGIDLKQPTDKPAWHRDSKGSFVDENGITVDGHGRYTSKDGPGATSPAPADQQYPVTPATRAEALQYQPRKGVSEPGNIYYESSVWRPTKNGNLVDQYGTIVDKQGRYIKKGVPAPVQPGEKTEGPPVPKISTTEHTASALPTPEPVSSTAHATSAEPHATSAEQIPTPRPPPFGTRPQADLPVEGGFEPTVISPPEYQSRLPETSFGGPAGDFLSRLTEASGQRSKGFTPPTFEQSAKRTVGPKLPGGQTLENIVSGIGSAIGSVGEAFSRSSNYDPTAEYRKGARAAPSAGDQPAPPAAEDKDGYATGGLIRASKGEYKVNSDGSNLGGALRHFLPGYADGGPIDVSNILLRNTGPTPDAGVRPNAMMESGLEQAAAMMGNSFMASVAAMNSTTPGPYVANNDGGGVHMGQGLLAGYHALDIRTNSGTIPTFVNNDVMTELQSSALGAKISSTGVRPSWYS
jgi:hypothetical protein